MFQVYQMSVFLYQLILFVAPESRAFAKASKYTNVKADFGKNSFIALDVSISIIH